MSVSAQNNPPPTYQMPSYDSHSDLGLGPYFEGELGPAFVPNFPSSRFGVPGTFSAEPGFRFSAEPGYNFIANNTLTLGGEFETGVIYNHLNQVWLQGNSFPLHGDYYQVPLLGNLVLRMNTHSFITPYIGAGGGGDISVARTHEPGAFFQGVTSDSQINPAFQAMGGINFRLNSAMDVGVAYKFLAAFPDHGDYIGTHAALATFTLKF